MMALHQGFGFDAVMSGGFRLMADSTSALLDLHNRASNLPKLGDAFSVGWTTPVTGSCLVVGVRREVVYFGGGAAGGFNGRGVLVGHWLPTMFTMELSADHCGLGIAGHHAVGATYLVWSSSLTKPCGHRRRRSMMLPARRGGDEEEAQRRAQDGGDAADAVGERCLGDGRRA